MGMVLAILGGAIAMPELLFHYPNMGISLWGNYFPASVPFVAGFATSAACLVGAAYFVPIYPGRLNIMRRLLLLIALGLVLILITPYQTNALFYWAHTFAAIYLYLVAGGGAAWAMLHAGKARLDWLLFDTLILGVILSALSTSYARILGLLALGQILALTGAALIIIRAARRWVAQEAAIRE
ncbi:MAG TPA: hypothetical protein VIS56_00420 [Candidatus Saccharimonadales bacterium]